MNKGTMKKISLFLVSLLLLSIFLVGCGKSEAEKPVKAETTTEAVKEKAEEVKEEVKEKVEEVKEKVEEVKEAVKEAGEGRLTISLSKPIGTMNPHKISGESFVTQAMVYEGLVDYGKDGKIIPVLAESWDISEDGKTYIFHLRKGVKYSDGTDFNAANLVKNFDSIFADRSKFDWFAFTTSLESWRAVDDHTFEVILNQAYSVALYDLAMIRPIRFLADAGFPDDGNTLPGVKALIGTGPWVIKDNKPGEYTLFERNEDYWGEKPKLKEVMVKIIPDSETRAMQFEQGDIDLLIGHNIISLDTFKMFQEDENYVTMVSEPMSSRLISLNSSRPIMSDLRIRKAISHSIDKEEISEGILGGIEKPADTIFAPNMPHAEQEKGLATFGFDLAKADELFNEAGWLMGSDGIRERDGVRLVLEFPYNSSSIVDKEFGQYLQGALLKAGVELELTGIESAAYWNNLNDGNFDLAVVYSWGGPWDPHSLLNSMTVSTKGGSSGYVSQQGFPNKQELDAKIKQALIEPDKATEDRLYREIYTILHDQIAYVPLSYQSVVAVYKKGVLKPFEFMPHENEFPVRYIEKGN